MKGEPYAGPVPNFSELFAAKTRANSLRDDLAAWDAAHEKARLALCRKLAKWAGDHPKATHARSVMLEAEAALTLLGDLVARVKDERG